MVTTELWMVKLWMGPPAPPMTTVSRFVSCEDECEELDGKTDEVCTSHDFCGNVTWSIKQDRTCLSNFPLRNFISFWQVSHTWLRYARVCVKIKIHPLSLPRGHTSHNFRWALLESVKLSNIWLYCVSVAQLRAARDRFRSVRRSDPVALKIVYFSQNNVSRLLLEPLPIISHAVFGNR